MNEIEMNVEEKTPGTTTHFGLPWEVPCSNQNEATKSRPTDMIKYCSNTILPYHYLEMSHSEEQELPWDQPQESQDFRYEHQCEFQDRGTHHGNGRQEAPVQQKISRTPEHCNFSRVMPQSQGEAEAECQSSYCATTEHNTSGTITQHWTWNPMYCDVVPPTNVSRLLPWNVY